MAPSPDDILALFDAWNAAIQTGNPDAVVALYATDAILVPTLSNIVRSDHPAIRDYFVHFLAHGPRATLDESHIRLFGDVALNAGRYTFVLADADAPVRARYSFVYRCIDGDWRIAEHHSSLLPEAVEASPDPS